MPDETPKEPISTPAVPQQSPIVMAILLGLFASSFAGQGARMMVDGYKTTSFILYGIAAILGICGAFWFKIKKQIWTGLANSVVAFANNAWSWFLILVLLLFSLAFSPVDVWWPSSPQASSFEPTFLRLQFNASGEKPQSIEMKNIEWAWDLTTSASQKLAPYKPPCPISPQLSNISQPCSNSIIPEMESISEYKWVIYLVFIQPIAGKKEVKVNPHGSALPKWKSYFLTDRKTYVQFDGDLAHTILDIEVVPQN